MSTPDHQPASRPTLDYYQILGLRPGSTVEQIKAAYRKRALTYHPDKNQGQESSTEQFKLCNDAYAVLSDPQKRTEYDRRYHPRGVQEIARGLLGDFFGSRRQRAANGRDLRYTLELPFVEAALGTQRAIHFSVLDLCSSCHGHGAAPGGSRPCPSCHGRGEIKSPGLMPLPRPCPRCGGQGISITSLCETCGGVGSIEQRREYLVTLQPGVKHHDTKIVAGQGEPGAWGGRTGDLVIKIRVEPHPFFKTRGQDLLLHAPLTLTTAALGGSLEVPTLEGRVRMKVPAGTQSGRVFRLPGIGLPQGKSRGDLLVQVELETPIALSEAQRQLLEHFSRQCTDEMYPRLTEYREKLKQVHVHE